MNLYAQNSIPKKNKIQSLRDVIILTSSNKDFEYRIELSSLINLITASVAGVPIGGDEGQVLVKNTDNDNDLIWKTLDITSKNISTVVWDTSNKSFIITLNDGTEFDVELPNSNTLNFGLIKTATQSQANSGSSSTVAITPKTLKVVLDVIRNDITTIDSKINNLPKPNDKITNVSTDYTLNAQYYDEVYIFDTNSNELEVTLNQSIENKFTVKNGGSNNLNVLGVIDGNSNFTLFRSEALTIVYSNSNYYTI